MDVVEFIAHCFDKDEDGIYQRLVLEPTIGLDTAAMSTLNYSMLSGERFCTVIAFKDGETGEMQETGRFPESAMRQAFLSGGCVMIDIVDLKDIE